MIGLHGSRALSAAGGLIVAFGLGSTPVGHAGDTALPVPLVIAQSAPGIGPGEAAAIVEQSSGGQVLSVGATRRGGQPVYQVKVLLPGGIVRVVRVDAVTGRVLN